MILVLTFDIDGEAERFIRDEWPLLRALLYTLPVDAHLDDENVTIILPLEDEVPA